MKDFNKESRIQRRVRPYILPFILIPLGLIIWSNALNGPFLYDDMDYIVKNPYIRSLWNFMDISGTRYLCFLSFAINYSIGGLAPFGFHLTNVLIHIINSILIFCLVKLTFDTPFMNTRKKERDLKTLSLCMATVSSIVFLSHPVNTQAVTYISQRFTSLATLFYLAAVTLYVKARLSNARAGGFSRSTLTFYLISLISTVCAMKTKEIAFTIPFAIVLYESIFFLQSSCMNLYSFTQWRGGLGLLFPFTLRYP
jgi:hypothetical protein